MTNSNLQNQLYINLNTTDEVYKAAVYGAIHNEAQILEIQKKLGVSINHKTFDDERYKNALKVIKVLSEDSETITIDFCKKDIIIIKKAVKSQLKVVKKIPQLAREQLLITYSTIVEGFVNDVVRLFLKKFPKNLKSKHATLKDNQLIDSILEGNTIDTLIDYKVRDIMYDSITGWIKYLNSRGFDLKEETNLKEMFLLRNAIIHNSKKVSSELEKIIGGRRYTINNQINITDRDIKRFRTAIDEIAVKIDKSYNKKLIVKHEK